MYNETRYCDGRQKTDDEDAWRLIRDADALPVVDNRQGKGG